MIQERQKQEMIQEQYAMLADGKTCNRNGSPIHADDCSFSFGEVFITGRMMAIIQCDTHGHGGMRELDES